MPACRTAPFKSVRLARSIADPALPRQAHGIYTFELFALDTKIDVKATADPWETRTAVYAAMQGHVLGKAVYVGLFRRPQ